MIQSSGKRRSGLVVRGAIPRSIRSSIETIRSGPFARNNWHVDECIVEFSFSDDERLLDDVGEDDPHAVCAVDQLYSDGGWGVSSHSPSPSGASP